MEAMVRDKSFFQSMEAWKSILGRCPEMSHEIMDNENMDEVSNE